MKYLIEIKVFYDDQKPIDDLKLRVAKAFDEVIDTYVNSEENGVMIVTKDHHIEATRMRIADKEQHIPFPTQ